MRALLVAAILCAGCPRGPTLAITPASLAMVEAPAWRTLSAQHRVQVTVTLDGGKRDVRTLRGLVAVERPDKLRLRALGPAGITLFDLRVRGGQPEVLASIRGPGDGAAGQTLSAVIASLAADLACAYDLAPRPPERRARLEGDAVVLEEPGRQVRLSRFAGTPPTWRRAEIRSGRYQVVVDVDEATADAALDPALFND